MFGGVRIYFDWGDVSKGKKMVLCKVSPTNMIRVLKVVLSFFKN